MRALDAAGVHEHAGRVHDGVEGADAGGHHVRVGAQAGEERLQRRKRARRLAGRQRADAEVRHDAEDVGVVGCELAAHVGRRVRLRQQGAARRARILAQAVQGERAEVAREEGQHVLRSQVRQQRVGERAVGVRRHRGDEGVAGAERLGRVGGDRGERGGALAARAGQSHLPGCAQRLDRSGVCRRLPQHDVVALEGELRGDREPGVAGSEDDDRVAHGREGSHDRPLAVRVSYRTSRKWGNPKG